MSMRSVYRKIARENGVSAKEVREEIQREINLAWNNPQKGEIVAAYQRQVPCKGIIPSPDEVILFASNKIRKH